MSEAQGLPKDTGKELFHKEKEAAEKPSPKS